MCLSPGWKAMPDSSPGRLPGADFRPPRSSSFMRSKISTFASTAMPILRMKPAMPGVVSVTYGKRPGIPNLKYRQCDQDISEQGQVGDHAGETIEQSHEEQHNAQPDQAGDQTLPNRFFTKGGPHGAAFDHFHRDRQSTVAQFNSQCVGFLGSERTLDDPRAIGDRRVHHGCGYDDLIQNDAEILSGMRGWCNLRRSGRLCHSG